MDRAHENFLKTNLYDSSQALGELEASINTEKVEKLREKAKKTIYDIIWEHFDKTKSIGDYLSKV